MSDPVFRDITIPANGAHVESVQGRYFVCISATASFKVEPNTGGKIIIGAGGAFGGEKSKVFRRLTFHNTTGTDIDVSFYAGDEKYELNVPIDNGSVSAIIGTASTTPQQFVKTSSTPATPVALSATSKLFQRATIIALKTLAGGTNSGNVNLGASSTVNQQPYVLEPGDEIVLEAPIGKQWNFTDWYLDVANSGDGVVVIYS